MRNKKNGIPIIGMMLLFLLCMGKVQAVGSFYDLKRSDIAFQVGASVPLGSFGGSLFNTIDIKGKNLKYNGAGVGVSYGLALDFYVINEYLGIYIAFHGHSNQVKSSDNIFTGVEPTSGLAQKEWKTEETDKWSEFMALAGITFRYPLLDWLVFTSRVGLGYAHLLSPFYSAQVIERNLTYSHDFSSNSKPAFGFAAGVGLKFLVSRGFHVDIRADYMGATNFSFDNTKSAIYLSNNKEDKPKEVFGEPTAYSFKEAFHVLDFSLGFTIAF